jgi:hypothetical protein|tara:strand:- start:9526 stop:9735 length:210 start_codon:yes stop_codon:yes gene_type:complete
VEISGKTLEILSKTFPNIFPNKMYKKTTIRTKYIDFKPIHLETPLEIKGSFCGKHWKLVEKHWKPFSKQ